MHGRILFVLTCVASANSLTAFPSRNNYRQPYNHRRASRLPTTLTFTAVSGKKFTRCELRHQRTKSALYASENDIDKLISSLLNDTPAISSSNSKSDDKYSQYTHQIAIPLSSSSELTSALHSIQTSLVRDCPRLIRACVMPATLRLPLLYVDASSAAGKQGKSAGGSGIFSGANEIDTAIENIVQSAIRTSVYNQDPEDLDGIGKLELQEPIMLPFRGLELQGSDNSVLYAIGFNINDPIKTELDMDEDGVIIVEDWGEKKESGYERLEQLVKTIQSNLEKNGYKTAWPLDEPQGNDAFPGEDDTLKLLPVKQKRWRPRVPFVRLPTDFYDGLDAHDMQENEGKNGIGMEEIDAFFSKGFDGISPTFWYEAWGEKDILPSPGVRMRSVQVYRRMMSGGGEAESSFHELPSSSKSLNLASTMDLPVGDAKLTAKEEKYKAKEMERMGEIESEAEREWEEGKARMLADDERQSEYSGNDDEEFDVRMERGDDVVIDRDATYSSPWTERDAASVEPRSSMSESGTTMQTTADTLSTSAQPPLAGTSKKKLPSVEDNPVFQRLWKGEAQINAQGESTAQSLSGDSVTENVWPPYPSDEHFVGVWKVVQSPLGVNLDGEPSSQSSDNLVLRVDGQVMGGPILDAQYQQKAAGGSWKMFQAVRKSDDNENVESIAQTRLRIKLLVPPEKTQMLVLEGQVTRVGFGGKASLSSSAFSGPGGVLDGMSTAKVLKDNETADSTSGEQVLFCGGEAWMENVDGSGKRRKLGPFSLTKQKTVDRDKLIYTVPASRGGPGAAEDESD